MTSPITAQQPVITSNSSDPTTTNTAIPIGRPNIISLNRHLDDANIKIATLEELLDTLLYPRRPLRNRGRVTRDMMPTHDSISIQQINETRKSLAIQRRKAYLIHKILHKWDLFEQKTTYLASNAIRGARKLLVRNNKGTLVMPSMHMPPYCATLYLKLIQLTFQCSQVTWKACWSS